MASKVTSSMDAGRRLKHKVFPLYSNSESSKKHHPGAAR